MTVWRAQVSIAAATGIPEDAVTNDFVIDDLDGTTATDGGPLTMTTALNNFYNTQAPGASAPLAFYMSRAASRGASAVSVKYFDITTHLDGSAVGSPSWADAFTLGAVDPSLQAPMPAEVAAKLTLRGVGWQGQPVDVPAGAPGPAGNIHRRARYTGGIYLGPLTFGAMDEADNTGHRVRLKSQFRIDATKAGKRLAEELWAAAPAHSFTLCVWSRKDANVRAVEHVQMDDACDTIRSRGPAASVRNQEAVVY